MSFFFFFSVPHLAQIDHLRDNKHIFLLSPFSSATLFHMLCAFLQLHPQNGKHVNLFTGISWHLAFPYQSVVATGIAGEK